MSSSNSSDGVHRAFIEWATSVQGVEIDGIDAVRISSRGYGIKASRDISEGDRLLFVPAKSLVTIHSPFVKARKFPRECTVHGRLHRLWEQTWPSQEDIKALPLLWRDDFSDLLPTPAKDMLEKQRRKIENDREALGEHINSALLSSELFAYYWLVVNSRCFYWDYPDVPSSGRPARRRKPLPTDECMALCPFADYFNHAEQGCTFDSDATGCWVLADRDYRVGEELYVSYGTHSNDLLLVEYGFVLPQNRWDSIKLDDCIVPRLSVSQKQTLKTFNMLGDYSMDHEEVCYRTQAALRAFVLPKAKWHNFLTGDYDGELEQAEVDQRLASLLAETMSDTEKITAKVERLEEGSRKDVLLQRWAQIHDAVYQRRQKLE